MSNYFTQSDNKIKDISASIISPDSTKCISGYHLSGNLAYMFSSELGVLFATTLDF